MKGSMQFILVAAFAAVFSARVRGQSCHPSVTTVSGSHAPRQVCAGKLIFEDNFNALDSNKWQHEKTLSGGGNWEFQWYSNSRANSFTRDGKLVLKPSLVSDQYGERFLSSGTLNIKGFDKTHGMQITCGFNAASAYCPHTSFLFPACPPRQYRHKIKAVRSRKVDTYISRWLIPTYRSLEAYVRGKLGFRTV